MSFQLLSVESGAKANLIHCLSECGDDILIISTHSGKAVPLICESPQLFFLVMARARDHYIKQGKGGLILPSEFNDLIAASRNKRLSDAAERR